MGFTSLQDYKQFDTHSFIFSPSNVQKHGPELSLLLSLSHNAGIVPLTLCSGWHNLTLQGFNVYNYLFSLLHHHC